MKKGTILGLILCLAIIFSISSLSFGQDEAPDWVRNARRSSETPLSIVSADGQVIANYQHGYLEVTGRGTQVTGVNKAQKIILAQEGARTNAYAKLGSFIRGVMVTERTTVEYGATKNYYARHELEETLVKNALILKETYQEISDGSIIGIVKLGYLLNGPQGLTGFLVAKNVPQRITGTDRPFVAAETPPAPAEPYTGLIVDAGGLKVVPALFPKVLAKSDGRAVYSAGMVNNPEVLMLGSGRYESNVERARNIKNKDGTKFVGDNPLVVRGVASEKGSSVVVSDDDAVEIYGADVASRFLRGGKVVFVLN